MSPRFERETMLSLDPSNDDVRTRWRELVEKRLPKAADMPGRNWPIRFDHCFARVLLDNACGCPWRDVVKPPACRNADHKVLLRAIALGEAILEGTADIHALNQHSLQLRGKAKSKSALLRGKAGVTSTCDEAAKQKKASPSGDPNQTQS